MTFQPFKGEFSQVRWSSKKKRMFSKPRGMTTVTRLRCVRPCLLRRIYGRVTRSTICLFIARLAAVFSSGPERVIPLGYSRAHRCRSGDGRETPQHANRLSVAGDERAGMAALGL